MNDLFVIAAGGTGAKVAEALIHLLAAGCGPKNVHILLVDGDTTNGNRNRSVQTWMAYQRLQSWPWLVKCEEDHGLSARLFNTNVNAYVLAERFDDVNQVGLLPQIMGDRELEGALRVLLNDSELTSNLSIGFTGRPNLGCLVMDRYLRLHFTSHPQGRAFLQALETSARPEESNPRVVVVGSVFGGTGASLLPVVHRCIASLFEQPNAQNQPRQHLLAKLRWGKVMQLPYFRPDGGEATEVNTNRHLTDTSSALWYYGEITRGNGVEPTYLVGSQSPQARIIPVAVGGADQINPAFYHEIVAALAVLDFYQHPETMDGRPIRHFSDPKASEQCSLDQLPIPSSERLVVLEKVATLLHLGAFWINWRSDEAFAYRRGLLQYAKTASLTGWDPRIHNWLNTRRAELTDQQGPASQAVDYFARLLLWATTSLSTYGASGLAFLSTDESASSYYSSLHNTLCCIKRSEICVDEADKQFQEQNDNIAARLCRVALAGLVRENASQSGKNLRGHSFALRPLRLVEDGARVRIGLPPDRIGSMLASHGVSSGHVNALCRNYGLPGQEVK